jgi:hypothetical protein
VYLIVKNSPEAIEEGLSMVINSAAKEGRNIRGTCKASDASDRMRWLTIGAWAIVYTLTLKIEARLSIKVKVTLPILKLANMGSDDRFEKLN